MPIISPKIPQGLEELMRGLAKSVIKENPENIYEYAAEYFENMLRERDGSEDQSYKKFATYKVYKKNKMERKKRDVMKSGTKDNNSSLDREISPYMKDVVVSSSSAHDDDDEKSIEKIVLPETLSSSSKDHITVSSESEINTAIIQDPINDDEGTPNMQSVNSQDDKKNDGDDDDDIKNMVMDDEMAHAALKIQSTFRGHKVRREMKGNDDDDKKVEPASLSSTDVMVNDDEEQQCVEIEKRVEEGLVENEDKLLEIEREEINNNSDSKVVMDEEQQTTTVAAAESENENEAIIQDDREKELIKEEIAMDEANIVISDEQSMNDEKLVSEDEKNISDNETQEHESVEINDCKENFNDVESVQQVEANEDENSQLIVDTTEIKNTDDDDDVANMVLDDEMEEAALKIQSAFRGHKMRKDVDLKQIDTCENEEIPPHENVNECESHSDELNNLHEALEDNVDEGEVVESTVIVQDNSHECVEDKSSNNKNDEDMEEKVSDEEKIMKNSIENLLDKNESVEQQENEIALGDDDEKQEESDCIDPNSNNNNNDEIVKSSLDENVIEDISNIENASKDKDEDEDKDEENAIVLKTSKEASIENVEQGIDNKNNNNNTKEDEDEKAAASHSESVENIENLSTEMKDDAMETALSSNSQENVEETSPTSNALLLAAVEEQEQEQCDRISKDEKATGSTAECESENLDDLNQQTDGAVEINHDEKNQQAVESENELQDKSVQLSQESQDEKFEKDEMVAVECADNDDGEQMLDSLDKVPVEEEICQQKIIGYLGPDANETAEIENIADEREILKASLEKMSSSEIKYEKLRESIDNERLVPADSMEKSETTDENSIDAETTASSIEEKNEQIKLENILQASISPYDLIDEVVNEAATRKVDEITPSSNDIEDDGKTNDDNSIKLENKSEENFEKISNPEAISLKSDDEKIENEDDVCKDEVLKPEKEESEIPEEMRVDEFFPTVENQSLSENHDDEIGSMILDEEMEEAAVKIQAAFRGHQVRKDKDKSQELTKGDDEDDVEKMILDDEMEEAAVKIQAAFRGHQVRKDKDSVTTAKLNSEKSNQDENHEEEEEERKLDSTFVIEQCSEANEEIQDQDDNEQQDTSADVDEIQESETIEQDNNDVEETHEEEVIEQESETNENETNEQGDGDDPNESEQGAEGETSEQQNPDDDDVANMVLDEEMEQAALKIQSTFRGHKTRMEIKTKEDDTCAATTTTEGEESKQESSNIDDDIANMVLDDEMAQAALKIQSTFRGHKARKDVKDKKNDDNEDEDNEGNEENKSDEQEGEQKSDEKPKDESTQQSSSSSTEKSAQQLQEEEDIANLVMDDEMEKTALKIQSAFRGKMKIKKKPQKDGSDSYESSAEDNSDDQNDDENEIFQRSEEKPVDIYEYFAMSNEYADEEKKNSYDEVDNNDFATRQSYGETSHEKYGADPYDTIYPDDDDEDLNLMHGGGIFVEPSGDSGTMEIATSNSDEDNNDPSDNNNKKNSDEKIIEQVSKIIEDDEDEKLQIEKKSSTFEDNVIENFNFQSNKDSAEALYYSLKKNEIEAQKRFEIDNVKQETFDEREMKTENKNDIDDDEDDDVVVVNTPPENNAKAKVLKYGMSMDDRLLGSILSQDYSKTKIYTDDGFDTLLEETMRSNNFLEKLHEESRSEDEKNFGEMIKASIDVGDDEDQFDDFYPGNIRSKIMASSISIADSDYFDPTNNKSIIDDDKIRTALETIHSTDSESTIGSAATKIQVNDKNISTRRNNNIQYSSIGNAAIDKSLDDFIQLQELKIVDRFEEEPEGYNSPPPKHLQESADDYTESTDCTESDKKIAGIIEIKLEQKHFLTVDERRRTLHREDAIQRNSTRSVEDESSKSSCEKNNIDKNVSQSMDAIGVTTVTTTTTTTAAAVQGQSSIIDTEITVPVLEKPKSALNIKNVKVPLKRQKTMPVQMESNVIRILPKHLRKRIRSAESEKKKRYTK